MPSTAVHAALALVLAAALLGDAYDRRALAAVLVLVTLPELDTVAGLFVDGAHRALLHNLVLPAAFSGLLYYDTRLRETSWIARRWGARGVRIAWVGLFVHLFAHVLLDYAHLEGINPFYPLFDRFYRLDGELALSTADGLVQTFVEVTSEPETGTASVDAGGTGTTADTHVANPVEPRAETRRGGSGPEAPVERNFPIAVRGWQLYVVLTGLFVLVARRFQDRDG